ncbi:signal recognition particle subunit SRP54 [Nematocida homosporus]|uniref:signal recognition particle subunit SRP54 n=1 Tax=Nematocida homosporus TaxID=1912981 RepID=UPI002220AE16|nr:signal recognition particle subunit SRP54 [Nematocida homosporus]KAI5184790.1 signal recognition particle subunit SRP54 [Nematocida homosporus]
MLSDLGCGISGALKGLFTQKGNEEKDLNLAVKKITTSLLSSNVSTRVVLGVKKRILERYQAIDVPASAKKEKLLQKIVFEELCRMVDPGKEAFKPKKKDVSVVLFVGLQGSGKTTSCCKYARYYRQRGFKVGIVCADTFRAGAAEQVVQNVGTMDVAVYTSSVVDPVAVARAGVAELRESCNLILVDTSGRHTQEGALFDEMVEIEAATKPTATIFVVDASIGQAAEVHAKAFMERIGLGAVIITKTDGTKNIGGALSSVAETQTPVAFVGTGEGMGQLEPFSPRGFVSKLMGLGDIAGLADKLEGLGMTAERQEELIGKIKAGEFSMGDFYEQFKRILELGPISQLLSLVPGMNAGMLDERTFRRMGTVFSGMTKKELRTNGEVFLRGNARIMRVAAGSGVAPTEIRATVNSYRMMSQMLRKLSSNPMFAGLFGGAGGAGAGGQVAPPTPETAAAQMAQLKKMMPPGFSSLFDQMGKFM